jgi:hypothetical protein
MGFEDLIDDAVAGVHVRRSCAQDVPGNGEPMPVAEPTIGKGGPSAEVCTVVNGRSRHASVRP